MYGWVVARVGLDDYVGVGWLSVDFCREFTVTFTAKKNIEECDSLVDFRFTCEFHSGVHTVEDFIKSLSRVFVVTVAAEARAAGCFTFHGAPTVIHVKLKMQRERKVFFSSDFYGCFHRKDHPNL